MHPRAILRATGGGTLVLGENNIVEECAEIVNRCDAVDERDVKGWCPLMQAWRGTRPSSALYRSAQPMVIGNGNRFATGCGTTSSSSCASPADARALTVVRGSTRPSYPSRRLVPDRERLHRRGARWVEPRRGAGRMRTLSAPNIRARRALGPAASVAAGATLADDCVVVATRRIGPGATLPARTVVYGPHGETNVQAASEAQVRTRPHIGTPAHAPSHRDPLIGPLLTLASIASFPAARRRGAPPACALPGRDPAHVQPRRRRGRGQQRAFVMRLLVFLRRPHVQF